MKVLFVIDCLASGGKERRLVELMKALHSIQKMEFELVVMDSNIHFKEIFDFNIKIHYLLRKSKKDLSIFLKLYKLCKGIHPDIIHCWDGMTAIYCTPVCKILSIPLINGLVTDAPQKQNISNKYWLRAKLTFPFSKFIISNSKAGIVAYNAPLNKSFVINNGFNFDRVRQVVSQDLIRKQLDIKTKFIVGMVASFTRYKDYKTFFDAAQLVVDKRDDVTFLAIGSNTDSETATNLIDKTRLERFRLLGNKSGVESYINSMDICVLASFTEGISNSILEYMALSKPVIATDGGGTNEIIVDSETGFLVKVSDPAQLANKMELLLQDDQLRIKMGKSSRERIVNVFSIEKMHDEYICVYNKAVQ